MGVLILNISQNTDGRVQKAIDLLTERVPDCRVIDTSIWNIQPCKGCCVCMVATPGQCVIRDDGNNLIKSILDHQQIVFIFDTALNFVDHRAKMTVDRMFPIANMELEFRNREILHKRRYDIAPELAILYTGKANRELMNQWLERIAQNLGAISLGAFPLEEVEEVCKCVF